MSVTLPYTLVDLDLGVPLDRHRAVVKPEWIDMNGHMNVGCYVIAFDHATDTFCTQLGVDRPYVDQNIGMTFVLEAHVTYDREVKQGDPLRVTTQVLNHDAKRVHFFHRMYHGDEGWLASTNELIMMNIDYHTRRSAPWPVQSLQRLQALQSAHAALPVPEQAGRGIGIRRR